jgi:hypothetical protein
MLFFLESINENPSAIDYTRPDFEVHNETDVEEAARKFSLDQQFHYVGFEDLGEVYRVYFQKKKRKSLFHLKNYTYIYYALPRSNTQFFTG